LDSLGAFSNFWALGAGKVMICAVPNARVATRAFLRPATVKVPLVMALDTHLRDALSNARRQGVEQNLCALPPVQRGSNVDLHQLQFMH